MAAEVVGGVVTCAIFELIERAKPGARKRLRALHDWVRDLGRPPPGLQLVTLDRTRYTGVAVLVNGEVELLFAMAQEEQRPQPAPYVVQPPPRRRTRVHPAPVGVDALPPPSGRNDDPDPRR